MEEEKKPVEETPAEVAPEVEPTPEDLDKVEVDPSPAPEEEVEIVG